MRKKTENEREFLVRVQEKNFIEKMKMLLCDKEWL